mgnify:CR=1 FL=1
METYSNYNPNTQTDLTQPTSEGSPASATNPPDSYPDSSSKISITNDKDYDIVLHPLANADQSPINSGPITIPAGQTTEIDIAALTGSESWAGNFEIRAADTNEPTGAMLEVATNQDIGAGEPSTYFNISYINGVPHNSNEEDFINTKEEKLRLYNYRNLNYFINRGKIGIIINQVNLVPESINKLKYDLKKYEVSISKLRKEIKYLGQSKKRFNDEIRNIIYTS